MVRLIVYAVVAAVIAGIVYSAWHSVDTWCNAACVEQQERVTALEAKVADLESKWQAARDRATQLALLWSEAINKAEKEYDAKSQERAESFAALRARLESVRQRGHRYAAGRIVVRPESAGMLADAGRLANGERPAAPEADQRPADPVPESSGVTTAEEWVTFALDAAEAYADVRNKWSACISAYNSLVTHGQGTDSQGVE